MNIISFPPDEKNILFCKNKQIDNRNINLYKGNYICVGDHNDIHIVGNDKITRKTIYGHHIGVIKCIVESLDKNFIYSGAEYPDLVIRKFDIRTKECVSIMRGHKSGITCLILSKDGKYLYSGSSDNTIIKWDLITNSPLFHLKKHTQRITCMVTDHDEKFLYSGSGDSTIIKWNLSTQSVVKIYNLHTDSLVNILITLDGKYLYSRSDDDCIIKTNLEKIEYDRLLTSNDIEEHTVSGLPLPEYCENDLYFNLIIKCSNTTYYDLKKLIANGAFYYFSDSSSLLRYDLSGGVSSHLYETNKNYLITSMFISNNDEKEQYAYVSCEHNVKNSRYISKICLNTMKECDTFYGINGFIDNLKIFDNRYVISFNKRGLYIGIYDLQNNNNIYIYNFNIEKISINQYDNNIYLLDEDKIYKYNVKDDLRREIYHISRDPKMLYLICFTSSVSGGIYMLYREGFILYNNKDRVQMYHILLEHNEYKIVKINNIYEHQPSYFFNHNMILESKNILYIACYNFIFIVNLAKLSIQKEEFSSRILNMVFSKDNRYLYLMLQDELFISFDILNFIKKTLFKRINWGKNTIICKDEIYIVYDEKECVKKYDTKAESDVVIFNKNKYQSFDITQDKDYVEIDRKQ
jgi:WD40 repeat protein